MERAGTSGASAWLRGLGGSLCMGQLLVVPFVCYLLPSTRCTVAPAAASVTARTQSRCTLAPAAGSYLEDAQPRRTLAAIALTLCTLTPGARSLLLLPRTRRTPAPGARSLLPCLLHVAHAHPHLTQGAPFTPCGLPVPLTRPFRTLRGSHLTMPYMTRTLPSSPTTHTTE